MAAKLVGEISEEGVANVFAELVAELLVTLSEQLAWQLIAWVVEKLYASAVAHIACPGVLCVQPGVLADQIAGWLIQTLIYQPVVVLLLALVEKLLGQLIEESF